MFVTQATSETQSMMPANNLLVQPTASSGASVSTSVPRARETELGTQKPEHANCQPALVLSAILSQTKYDYVTSVSTRCLTVSATTASRTVFNASWATDLLRALVRNARLQCLVLLVPWAWL